jgi:hypothetical protein
MRLLLALVLVTSQIIAQAPLRVEITPKSSSDQYYVVPIGKEGLILFNETDEKAPKGKKLFSFTIRNLRKSGLKHFR